MAQHPYSDKLPISYEALDACGAQQGRRGEHSRLMTSVALYLYVWCSPWPAKEVSCAGVPVPSSAEQAPLKRSAGDLIVPRVGRVGEAASTALLRFKLRV